MGIGGEGELVHEVIKVDRSRLRSRFHESVAGYTCS